MLGAAPSSHSESCDSRRRLRLHCNGTVQGVGFRPYVFRLAGRLGLAGWVENSGSGAVIEIEGDGAQVQRFLVALRSEALPTCVIHEWQSQQLAPAGEEAFVIRQSRGGEKRAWVLPDNATCADCLKEIFDPGDRRYLFPFTNCTACGPRFSIIEDLPYDRSRTTMKKFVMCARCQQEYDDPADRRFHAQTNACPDCGPKLELWDASGKALAQHNDALCAAAAALGAGAIVAVKAIGGFHLMANAADDAALARLRARKRRPDKPLALLYPSLARLRADCAVAPLEESLLTGAAAPITLLRRLTPAQGTLSELIAPGNPYLGVMLPNNPLQHLLMRELPIPLIATSGNLAEEPIYIEEREALRGLAGIADLFLIHDRPICHQLDDSILRVVAGQAQVLRRARGYAPLPLVLAKELPNLLALGGQQKNSLALARGRAIFISQHIGDLDNARACAAFEREAASLQQLYEGAVDATASDRHPDYHSTRYAQAHGLPAIAVQHHHAHLLSCMVDNQIEGEALGIVWDGTGLGLDGTFWGGEFFRIDDRAIERMATLRRFRLPGADKAIKEPRRVLLALLYELYGDAALHRRDIAALDSFAAGEIEILGGMLRRAVQAPLTSSVGRLFDGAAALLDLCQVNSFEGQGAMALEFAAEGSPSEGRYPLPVIECGAGEPWRLDWGELIEAMLAERAAAVPAGEIAAKFHNTLVAAVVSIAERAERQRVVLSGGCFQNRLLTERTVARLRAAGFQPYWHRGVPPNDGGLAVGQIIGSTRALRQP